MNDPNPPDRTALTPGDMWIPPGRRPADAVAEDILAARAKLNELKAGGDVRALLACCYDVATLEDELRVSRLAEIQNKAGAAK